MEIIYAIIIGIVQGFTEFLPISSTAHMTIVAKLIGAESFRDPKIWTASMATIQLGTLCSLLVYFRKEIFSIGKDFFYENLKTNRKNFDLQSKNSRVGWLIIIGSVPIFVLGYLFKDIIEGNSTKNITFIVLALIFIAVFMFIAEKTGRFYKTLERITLFDAIIFGFAQALALFPGVSRSGATITAGIFLGFKREDSARFSFLLSIPAVFVSGIYEFYSNFQFISTEQIWFIVVSSIFAFVSGILAISFLLSYLQNKSTMVFIVYRILLGTLILFWLWLS